MKTINFLIFATCLLVTLNSNVMAMKGEDPKAQSSDSHLAELKELDAWCPLDGKLTGLDWGIVTTRKFPRTIKVLYYKHLNHVQEKFCLVQKRKDRSAVFVVHQWAKKAVQQLKVV